MAGTIGRDFLEVFSQIGESIDLLMNLTRKQAENYTQLSMQLGQTEEARMREYEARLEVEKELAAAAQVHSEDMARFSAVINSLAATQQQRDEANAAAAKAVELVRKTGDALKATQIALDAQLAAFATAQAETKRRDEEQDAERAQVLERLGTVRAALSTLVELEGQEESGSGYAI